MYKQVILVSLLAMTALGWQGRRTPVLPLEGGAMILEWVPGKEAVVRITAENEEDLEHVRIFHPDGRQLIELDTRSGGSGLAGLDLELREPDLARLVEKFAGGRYEIHAATVCGKLVRGQANLSHDLPAAPRVVQPRPDELVQASSLTVYWLPDRSAAAYELQLEQGEDDGLRVRLPPERRSFQVPREFLESGTRTTLEVTAIGANGNRTVTEMSFTTRP